MDIVDSIKKDKAYLKCKVIVKDWEKQFKIQHSRTPSKFDIKEAPANIKYAYKKYFQLKSSFLENSLLICDNDEPESTSPELKQLDKLALDSQNSQTEELLPALPSGQEIHKLLSNCKSQTNVVDSSHFVENLSKKLFNNKQFSIRNPRKLSLSKTFSVVEEKQNDTAEKNTNELLSIDSHENGLFTCNIATDYKSKLINDKNQFAFNVKAPSRKVDDAWLSRAINLNNVTSTENKYDNKLDKFGISNISVPNVLQKPSDYIDNSESEEEKEISKLKPALKKRKLDDGLLANVSQSQLLKNFQSNELNTSSDNITSKKRKSSSKMKIKPQICHEVSEQFPPDIKEYLPFGLDETVIPRHHNITDILKTIDSSSNLPEDKENTKESKLKDKIRSGSLNENFVKINIEKKVFVRGKKSQNYSKYKKQQWKDKKALHASMEFPENGKINCFKCGLTGHMARYCSAHKGDTLLPLDSYDDNDLPTLEDMQSVVSQESKNISDEQMLSVTISSNNKVPDSFLKLLEGSTYNFTTNDIKPIYENHLQAAPQEIYDILKMFGHESFRSGQEKTIMRILCGMSTLLILSTGGGKSLCYQLPAYVYSQHYKCITLVISPLVSLMEDQVLSMPEFLKAGCLHSNQSPTQRGKIIQYLKDGEINILLISPEALISGDSSKGFMGIFKSLPKIAFACIDEAHCVSQWSHNFRPSYLMICRILREKLNVNCILGLTATASQPTIKSVISHINIPDAFEGVITNPTLPDNLILSVSFEKDKDRALVSYLASERIESFNSIIVYCIRRDECERVAAILRSCLQEPHKINMEKQNKKRKRMSYISEAYHAGMSAAHRKRIQHHFMNGTLRIIVATVAFGMGINKSNIRCIIHYNMPSSFESYVQEVGRAGRDGKTAYCHVFMNNSNNDRNELLKHIHANAIDRPVIRKLLQRVFIPCNCDTQEKPSSSSALNNKECKGHEVGIPIDSTVEELDLPSENIATLLCYIELHPKQYIKVLNNAYIMCKISSYGGPKKILEAAKGCAPLAMAYLIEGKKEPEIIKNNVLEFNVIEVAAAIGWESGMTKYHLKNLEWIVENGSSKRSQLKVEFHTLGFRIKAPGNLNPAELDNILDDLHTSVITQEKNKLNQLEEINRAFSKLGDYSFETNNLSDDFIKSKSDQLKSSIRKYFERSETIAANVNIEQRPLDIERVTSDVCALLSSYKDCDFTGRSIARIFQGISSPNYPAIVWGRCKYWRSHIHEDFYGILRLATEQIIRMKMD